MHKYLSRQLDSVPTGSTLEVSRTGRFRRDVWVRRWPAMAMLVGVSLSVLAWWIGSLVDRSVRDLAKDSVTSALRSSVSAVELWMRDRIDHAESIAGDEEFRTAAVAVLDAAANDDKPANRKPGSSLKPPAAVPSSSSRPPKRAGSPSTFLQSHASPEVDDLSRDDLSRGDRSLDDFITSASRSAGAVGWVITDSQFRVVAGSMPDWIGEELPLSGRVATRLLSGEGGMFHPFRGPVPNAVRAGATVGARPLMAAAASIRSGRRPIGNLLLLLDPHDHFAKLLRIGRRGNSGETVAFDRDGMLISPSRFESQLRAMGVMSSDVTESSVLNVRLERILDSPDPSVANSPTPRSLTPMADSATRGGAGFDIRGYQSYYGVEVIGAWQWLANYEMGFAHEAQTAEVFRPSRILRSVFWVLVGVVIALASIVFGITSLCRRLFRRAERSAQAARRLGQYELGELLGYGGMGSVYRGRHSLLRRDVAVKVLEGEHATLRSLSRFEREVQATALLRHPNTIDIYDYGRTENGTFFYVMEFVDGITLQQLVEYYGPQPPERVVYLLRQVCGSLAEAHDRGVIHRDIKPANLLLTAQAGLFDMIKVLDFGLVKDMSETAVQLTHVESLTGTPLFVAPETIRSPQQSDRRSDIYSVGAVGYVLLTGRPTFDGETAVDICTQQLGDIPMLPSERLGRPVPSDLERLVMRCLQRDPDDRPRSITDLLRQLQDCACAFEWSETRARVWWEETFESPRDAAAMDSKHRTLAGDPIKFPEDKTHSETLF